MSSFRDLLGIEFEEIYKYISSFPHAEYPLLKDIRWSKKVNSMVFSLYATSITSSLVTINYSNIDGSCYISSEC